MVRTHRPRQAAARAWHAWTDRVLDWNQPPGPEPSGAAGAIDAPRLLAKARIETHYARYRYFLAEDQLLRGVAGLPAVPMTLVHGRRDLVCPLEGTWTLHRAVPGSRLLVVDAGHLISEPAITDALITETDRIVSVLS